MKVAILAGGTGGHIFPALAVAEALKAEGHELFWIGAAQGMETEIVPKYGIPLVTIQIQNLRGKGFLRYVMLPVKLTRAILKARRILKQHQVDLVLGFGGFVAGPGGVAAKLLSIPLIIHEQNAVAGLTNRYLAKIAKVVLTGFPGVLNQYDHRVMTGNPVRADLLPLRDQPYQAHWPLQVLVIGGSLGAQIFNETLPQILQKLKQQKLNIALWQQTGPKHFEETRARFAELKLDATVTAFIDDMNAAYTWADLVICRAGALTVAELAVIGKPAVLVPYPHAVDDHQTENALEADHAGAALLVKQSDFTVETMVDLLRPLVEEPAHLNLMAAKMHGLGRPNATGEIVKVCGLFGNVDKIFS